MKMRPPIRRRLMNDDGDPGSPVNAAAAHDDWGCQLREAVGAPAGPNPPGSCRAAGAGATVPIAVAEKTGLHTPGSFQPHRRLFLRGHPPTAPPRHRATAPPRHRATAPPRHRATAPPRHRATMPLRCQLARRHTLSLNPPPCPSETVGNPTRYLRYPTSPRGPRHVTTLAPSSRPLPLSFRACRGISFRFPGHNLQYHPLVRHDDRDECVPWPCRRDEAERTGMTLGRERCLPERVSSTRSE